MIILWCALGVGCTSEPEEAAVSDGRVRVSASMLTNADDGSEPIMGATYELTISSLGSDGAWKVLVSVDRILSSNVGGGMSYIAPCETYPDGGARINQAQVRITSVLGSDGEPLSGVTLPPAQRASFKCVQAADTAVPFTFTLVRQANRGFTDISVRVEDIECAAKFDCPQALLTDDAGRESPTLVTGLACGNGTEEVGSLSFVSELTCFDRDGVAATPDVRSRVYNGFELQAGRVYYNTATLIDEDLWRRFVRCELSARGIPSWSGLASAGASFAQNVPYIAWHVDLSKDEGSGGLACNGSVDVAYLEARAAHGAEPRVPAAPPTRDAPIRRQTYFVENGTRRLPDCSSSEQDVVETRAALERAEGDVAVREAAYAAAVNALAECREGQRERAAVSWGFIDALFPTAFNAPYSAEFVKGWLEVIDGSGRVADVAEHSACAFGDAEHIERIAVQVHWWSFADEDGELGFVDLWRTEDGFDCLREPDHGGCEVFALTEFPCPIDMRTSMSPDGYVISPTP